MNLAVVPDPILSPNPKLLSEAAEPRTASRKASEAESTGERAACLSAQGWFQKVGFGSTVGFIGFSLLKVA